MKRLFIALPVSEDVRTAACALQERLGGGVKWVERENLHVTLAFLGNTPDKDVPAIVAAMEAAAKRPSFAVSFGAVEARPGVVWVRVEEGAAELAAMARQLPGERENDYRPHLTLGRPSRDKLKAEGMWMNLGQQAGELVLYESKLTGKGPTYTALKTVRIEASTGGRSRS
jgi:2'-5' RNA ligase